MQTPRTNTTPVTGFPNRIPRCIWCDSTDHIKQQCSDLRIAIKNGLIRYNNENHIVNASTGQEIPPMFNRGGMKIHLNLQNAVVSAPSIELPVTSSLATQSFGPLVGSSSIAQSPVPLSSVGTSSCRSSAAPSFATHQSITLPAKKPISQTEDPATVLVTSYETTLSAFLQCLGDYEIDLDSIITSISAYKDGTTGYNITTSMGEFRILERPKTYTGPWFLLLRYNKAC